MPWECRNLRRRTYFLNTKRQSRESALEISTSQDSRRPPPLEDNLIENDDGQTNPAPFKDQNGFFKVNLNTKALSQGFTLGVVTARASFVNSQRRGSSLPSILMES